MCAQNMNDKIISLFKVHLQFHVFQQAELGIAQVPVLIMVDLRCLLDQRETQTNALGDKKPPSSRWQSWEDLGRSPGSRAEGEAEVQEGAHLRALAETHNDKVSYKE